MKCTIHTLDWEIRPHQFFLNPDLLCTSERSSCRLFTRTSTTTTTYTLLSSINLDNYKIITNLNIYSSRVVLIQCTNHILAKTFNKLKLLYGVEKININNQLFFIRETLSTLTLLSLYVLFFFFIWVSSNLNNIIFYRCVFSCVTGP